MMFPSVPLLTTHVAMIPAAVLHLQTQHGSNTEHPLALLAAVSHLFGALNFYSKPLRSKRYGIKASIPPDLSQCLERHKDATIILYDAGG